MMLQTKYLGLVVLGKIFLHNFIIISLCDPCGGAFWPHGHNLNKLGGGPLGDATHQI